MSFSLFSDFLNRNITNISSTTTSRPPAWFGVDPADPINAWTPPDPWRCSPPPGSNFLAAVLWDGSLTGQTGKKADGFRPAERIKPQTTNLIKESLRKTHLNTSEPKQRKQGPDIFQKHINKAKEEFFSVPVLFFMGLSSTEKNLQSSVKKPRTDLQPTYKKQFRIISLGGIHAKPTHHLVDLSITHNKWSFSFSLFVFYEAEGKHAADCHISSTTSWTNTKVKTPVCPLLNIPVVNWVQVKIHQCLSIRSAVQSELHQAS